MQIKNIILYKDEKNVRVLNFNLGETNIITGESKSGKTAIIDIVDYCLGSNDCRVAEGVIKDNVYWFAITIVFNGNEHFFFARQNPNTKQVLSTSEIYFQRINENEIPNFNSIIPNSNIKNQKDFLSRKLNIAENIQLVENNTPEALEVNFKHARIFCYQPQVLIAQRDYLFYNQTEPFVPQAIKDSLPYFLGAIREDSLKIEQDIILLRRELNRMIREKNENEKIKGEEVSKAFALVEEAKSIGLLNRTLIIENLSQALDELNRLKDWDNQISNEVVGENTILKDLIQRRQDLRIQLDDLDDTISATESFINNNFSYSNEVKHQVSRLEFVKLFGNEESVNERETCPLCDNELNVKIPSISEINNSLRALHDNLETSNAESPRLLDYLNKVKTQKNDIANEILKSEQSIAALYNRQEKERRVRDLNIARGKVAGRISLFLESVSFEESSDTEQKIKQIREKIDELSLLVDKEQKDELLFGILNKLNLQMSTWVKDLDVEYTNAAIRFDINKLTIYADTENRSISLNHMGSGANWVSYHLLIHFALHKHFIQSNRPVPRFLIIDQPSQVYYPPEQDSELKGSLAKSADEIAVKQMFDFILNVTKQLFPDFQVIITDHAYLNYDEFKNAVREVWRDGKKLIPKEWYTND